VIAFIVALIAVKTFISYVQKHSFRAFGIYRIIAGLAVFALIWTGVIKKKEAAPQQGTAQITAVSDAHSLAVVQNR